MMVAMVTAPVERSEVRGRRLSIAKFRSTDTVSARVKGRGIIFV